MRVNLAKKFEQARESIGHRFRNLSRVHGREAAPDSLSSFSVAPRGLLF
jgi:hypothetical protein